MFQSNVRLTRVPSPQNITKIFRQDLVCYRAIHVDIYTMIIDEEIILKRLKILPSEYHLEKSVIATLFITPNYTIDHA